MTKLSRKQIAEGLEAVPIEAVLLGATNPKGIKLTSKQKRFAEEIARGETKAGAYRKAYNSKGSPRTASRRGQELAKKGAVSAQVDAIRLALERQKYTTPAALRALVIDRLTEKAIDPELPPAQQLRALQLLGTVTEVAAFTARSETRTITDSADIRKKLIESIRTAIKADAIDVETIQSDDLLAEIAKSRKPPADADSTPADPTAPAPPAHDSADSQAVIHTIPLIQSSPQEAHLPNSQGVEMESNSDTQNY